jgi:hypothetical protein
MLQGKYVVADVRRDQHRWLVTFEATAFSIEEGIHQAGIKL